MLGLPSKCAPALRTAAFACQGSSKQAHAHRLISGRARSTCSVAPLLIGSGTTRVGRYLARNSGQAFDRTSRRSIPVPCQCARYLSDAASVLSSSPSPSSSLSPPVTNPPPPSPRSRVETLPLWSHAASTLEEHSSDNALGHSSLYDILGTTTMTPTHPTLRDLQSNGVHFYDRQSIHGDNQLGHNKTLSKWPVSKDQVFQAVMRVLADQTARLEYADYAYILAIMDQALSTQQQFWRFLAHFTRRTITKENDGTNTWKGILGKYIVPIYQSQEQSVFLQQLARLEDKDGVQGQGPESTGGAYAQDEAAARARTPLLTDQYILGKLMIESLMYPGNDDKEAALLFEALSEQSQIRFNKDVFGMLVKRATLSSSTSQISRLGTMMLRHEDLFALNKVPNRPLQIYRIYMENFLHKACELGLETMARDVFQASLAAGRCLRASCFNLILNSYSTKQFGPALLPSSTALLHRRRQQQQQQNTGLQHGQGKRPNRYRHHGNGPRTIQKRLAALSLGKLGRSMLTTRLEPVDELVSQMERLGVAPDMGTLNILVKLYLEVDLQGVLEPRPWQQVFTCYNPSDLKPDTVTCNTLLAYYEQKGDLAMMRTIYESMATSNVVVGSAVKSRRQRRKEAREQDPSAPTEEEEGGARANSQRDVYTYNTMLNALLQHAKEPKDVAAVGQVFFDMEQDGIPADTVTFNTNIMFHIRRGDFVAAMQVYQEMLESEPVSQGFDEASMLGQVEDRPIQRRRTIRKSLPSWSRQPSSTTSAVETLEKASSDPLSDLSIPKSRRPALLATPPTRDVATYTSLMSGYGQSSQMEIATFFFSEMVRLGLEPNLKTYSTLIAGLERAGDFQRAQTLWDMVLQDGRLTVKERKLVEALRESKKQQ